MDRHFVHGADRAQARHSNHGGLWSALLCLCGLLWLWSGTASAQSVHCAPMTISVANGATHVIDASACDGPDDGGIGGISTPPTHGTATTNVFAQTVTYTHNGNTATSDSFAFEDGVGGTVAVTVNIGAPTSPITVTPATLSPVLGQPFNATMGASGGTAPYAFVHTAGTLPTGMTFAAGTFAGTPTQRGTFPISITVTDSSTPTPLTTVKSYSIVVPTVAPTISPASLPAMAVGIPYTATLTSSGGVAPYTYSVQAEPNLLPPGLSLSSATGVISGTPTATGTYTFRILSDDNSTAQDASQNIGSRLYTVTVAAAPTIVVNPATLPNATAAVAYSQTLSASGGTAPYSFAVTAGALPAGLTLSSTGSLSGTPSAVGSFNFTVSATDANSFVGSRAYSLVVAPPNISVDPPTLPAATVGVAYSQTLSASGGNGSYTFSAPPGALPPGLSISAGGVLSGTPTAGGSFNFMIIASDQSTGPGAPYAGSRAYIFTVNPATVTLPTTSLANGTVASAYSATLNPASGGTSPYTYALTAGALPPGVSLSASTGALSGTPTAPGTFNFAVVATDSSTGSGPYNSAPRGYSLQIVDIAPVANPVSATVAYNAGATPITLSITGGTPASVAIGSMPAHGDAIATGTSITYQPDAGYYGADSFTYTATNGAGTSAPATVTITVAPPTVTVAPSGPLNAQVGASYSVGFTWSGGAAPYASYSASGLPAGLSLTATGSDSLTVSGTPTQAGSFTVNVQATDSSTGDGPFTKSESFTLAVAAPTLSMTPAAGNIDMPYGVATTVNFSASGGTPTYSYSIAAGSLPVGVSLSSAGVLSGTPTVPGLYTLSIRATDSSTGTGAPFQITQNYVIQVGTPTITIDPPSLPDGTAGTAYSASFSASGGVAPYSYSLLAGSLPLGMSFSSAGTLSGTPRSDGNFSLTVRATDANGQNAAVVRTLRIDPATVVISPATLPGGVVGAVYSQSLSSSGGIAPYTYSIVSGTLPVGVAFSSAGTVSGTPVLAGSYAFTVRSTDDAGYNSTIGYTIVVADSVPVAVDDSASTVANSPATIDVVANDSGIISSIAIATSASHGSAAVSGTNVIYTPAANYFGSDSFTYTATGPGGTSAPATVTVTVAALPVPVGQPQTATTLSTQAVTIDAATGATGSPFTGVTLLAPPSSGTATIDGTRIVYTPAADTAGAIALTYTLNNAFGPSAPITSTITVNAVPVAVSRRVRTVAGAAVVVELTTGARGGPFTAANLVSLTPASSGTATIVGSGGGFQLRYTPVIGYAGVAVASFTLSNAHATSAAATIEIEVAPRSDPSKDAEVLGLLGAQTSAARRFANSQIGNFQQRMQGLHEGGENGARFDNGLSFSVDSRCRDEARRTPGSDCRQALLGDDAAAMQEPAPVAGSGSRYGVWTGGTINSGNRDGRSGSAGFDFETSGISAGADVRLSDAFALGGGVGYGRDDTDIGQRGSRSEAESYSLVGYASYHPGKTFYLDGLLGYQWLSFDTRRYVTDTGAMVHGSRDGKQWFGSVSAGFEHQRDRLRVTPYARLDIARARLDGYAEHGDPLYALHYRDQDVDTTTTSLGLRIDYRYDMSWGRLSPRVLLEYQHDFEDDSVATMSYADMLGGPFYRARILGLDRNRYVFGLGAVLQGERDWALRFEYRGLFGSGDDDDHSFLINFEKKY